MTTPAETPELEASNRLSLWALVVLALLIRLLLLSLRGDYLVYDEGYYLLLARSLRAGEGFTLNGLPHVALSPLQPLVVAALSVTGLPDLWASRLLAAVCGALLVLPVASLAARCFGERGARTAGLLVACHPALLTFLPFFPGESWNLYFGSEPLYLLLAVSAVAAAAQAAVDESWRWWIACGALGALAWLTRLEGIVLSAALGAALLGALLWRRRLALWPRAALAVLTGALVAAPYLVWLHGALGRWALSGRVQAAAAAPALEPAGRDSSGTAPGGSDAVSDFVWGGDTEGLWRTLYALDASGTRMASQYWGVSRDAGPAGAARPGPSAPDRARDAAPTRPPAQRSAAMVLVKAMLIVVPPWFLLLGVWGVARVRPVADLGLWLAPMVVAALLPAVLAYAEPRAMLLLVPASCIGAAGACEYFRSLLEQRSARAGLGVLVPASVVVALALPTARDAARAWDQTTPLQQVSAARRVVGQYLGERLPHEARIVSWHPAVALWARRDWRVLPYEPLDRIVGYARAQQASVLVFSRFEPSPLTEPPRAFTAILLDSTSSAARNAIRLEPVESTPSLFVGRLGP